MVIEGSSSDVLVMCCNSNIVATGGLGLGKIVIYATFNTSKGSTNHVRIDLKGESHVKIGGKSKMTGHMAK